MKVLLFGGTFDPPHNGHMNNLKAAIATLQPDRVIVMPAGIPPHKADHHTPGTIRMEMCACFKPLFPALEISDWEIDHEGKSYTIHTLEMLRERFPEAELYMAMGSDMLLTFTEWHRWQEILQLTTLVVESRNAGDMDALEAAAENLRARGGRVLFCAAEPVPLSSTAYRAGVQDIDALPAPVPCLIRKYGLYGQGRE